MNYLKLVIHVDEEYQEPFIAELMDLDFYGFEQLKHRLIAYIQKPRYNDSNREYIEQIVIAHPHATGMEMSEEEERNWNETWEESIKPQEIGPFLVRPTWSPQTDPGDKILLEIDPKMSFGTGYHATTRLMLKHLAELDMKGKTILDAGTGTGILAIAAISLGASHAVGFDIDPWSERNAIENALLNGVDRDVEIRQGGIETVKDEEEYDVVLANINRNIIIEYLPALVKRTKPGGEVCLSGLMETDREKVLNEIGRQPVTVEKINREEEWILVHLKKKENG